MKNVMNTLVVIGMNHETSTISEREIFQINRTEIPDALKYFQSHDSVEGSIIVPTCNRIEFYLVLKKNIDPFNLIAGFYKGRNITAQINKNLFYTYSDGSAAKHLFKVVCGLESMVLGEYQIQGQIKEAYSIACSVKSADKILHKLFHSAFRVGKEVRSKTKIGSGKQSLSGIAFQIIKDALNPDDTVSIIGVNQNTKIAAEKLFEAGYKNLVFINRTLYKAERLAGKYNAKAYNLDNLNEALSGTKCIFSCTGSPSFIINSDLLSKIFNNDNFPKLIIDMAVPRDIDTSGLNKNIRVFDLEGLKKFLDHQKNEISIDLPAADKIIDDETKIFEEWHESRDDESIAYFTEKLELIRLQLMEETKIQVSEDELQLLDKFSRSLTHRVKSTINQIIKTVNKQNKAS